MRRILDWIFEHPKTEVRITAFPPDHLRITLKHHVDKVEYVFSKESLALLDLDFDYSFLIIDLLNNMYDELMGNEKKGE